MNSKKKTLGHETEKQGNNSKDLDEICESETADISLNHEEHKKDNALSPKKRGRKRKQVEVDSPHITFNENVGSSTKRSVRKKNSIDYFSLANPDDDTIPEQKIVKVKNKTFEQNDQQNHDKSTKRDSLLDSNEIEKENITIKLEHDEILNSSADPLLNDTCTSKDSERDESETLDNNQKPVTGRKSKYRKSGVAKELMNTLIAQAELKIEDSNSLDVPKSSNVMKRGRPSKSKQCLESATLNVDAEEQIFRNSKTVICAVCKKELDKNAWTYHKQRYHNNLAWRIGEPALDLNNIEMVKYILNALYVAKKPFHCDICDKTIKSVPGFLSHKSVCGKESEKVKVACELCGKKMLPVSMQSHMRFLHADKNNDVPVLEPKKVTARTISREKRQASEKALNIINKIKLDTIEKPLNFSKYFEDVSYVFSKEAEKSFESQIEALKRVRCLYPECDFECITTKDIQNHLKFCMKKPEDGFVCKKCLLVQLSLTDAINHLEAIHKEKIEAEKTNKVEKMKPIPNSTTEKEKPQQKKWPKFLLPVDRTVDQIFQKSYPWTLKFCEMSYSTAIPEEHFPCLKSDWNYMNIELVEDYLPKMPYSCDVGFETVVGFQDVLEKDHAFRKFELFESYLENNGNSTIFCGGPVTAVAWMPTPYDRDDVHQIVAVTTKSDPDDHYQSDVNYNEKCFIQFWDVGPLKNSETSLFRPRQAMCLTFDHGPVWDLQWCPSNCFDVSDPSADSDRLRRMGVLAVAGSDSRVYIYSIPYFKEGGQFYDARPVLILTKNYFEDKMENVGYFATRMSWTKAPGHRYFAVGYSNGKVAIFDLFTKSPRDRYKTEDNFDILTSYTNLNAHYLSITAIALHHSHGGRKWLMTGSYDRTVHTWDVQSKRCIRTVKRNIVNDAAWMTHWMCHIIGYDEASTTGYAFSAIHQLKDGLSDPLYLFHCASAIASLSTSDWLNGIIQANTVGEVFATFPKQLMMNLNLKNMKNKKLLFGYNTLVEKNKTVEERIKVNSEKEKALRNQLKIKTKINTKEIPSDREVMHLDYNPHYFEYEPLMYHEMDEKYGLIFCDHKMKKWSDFPAKLQEDLSHASEKYTHSRPNMYPLQAITKIQFNMNRQASVYYASGHQAGFLRLTYMKFLSEDRNVVNDGVNMRK